MFSVTEIFVPHKEQQAEGEPRLLLSVLHKFYLFFSDKLYKSTDDFYKFTVLS